MKPLTLFLPFGALEVLRKNLEAFNHTDLVEHSFILAPTGAPVPEEFDTIFVSSPNSSDAITKMASHTETPYLLLYSSEHPLNLSPISLHRMIQVAENLNAGMVYSDYYAIKDNLLGPSPVIDYQPGSLRDDFNFGSLLLFNSEAFRESAS